MHYGPGQERPLLQIPSKKAKSDGTGTPSLNKKGRDDNTVPAPHN